MMHFFKNRLVFTALAAAVLTTNISVHAMELNRPEGAENIFAQELALLEDKGNRIEVDSLNMSKLYKMIQELALKLEIEMPKVYVVRNEDINAEARGKIPLICCVESHCITLNTGLIKQPDTEIEFVIAHELSHLKLKHNIKGLGFSLIAITFITIGHVWFCINNINLPSHLAYAILSICGFLFLITDKLRAHEKEADLHAVQICGSPEAALSFFNKILNDEREDTANFLSDLTSTHPHPKIRIKYTENAIQKQD